MIITQRSVEISRDTYLHTVVKWDCKGIVRSAKQRLGWGANVNTGLTSNNLGLVIMSTVKESSQRGPPSLHVFLQAESRDSINPSDIFKSQFSEMSSLIICPLYLLLNKTVKGDFLICVLVFGSAEKSAQEIICQSHILQRETFMELPELRCFKWQFCIYTA